MQLKGTFWGKIRNPLPTLIHRSCCPTLELADCLSATALALDGKGGGNHGDTTVKFGMSLDISFLLCVARDDKSPRSLSVFWFGPLATTGALPTSRDSAHRFRVSDSCAARKTWTHKSEIETNRTTLPWLFGLKLTNPQGGGDCETRSGHPALSDPPRRGCGGARGVARLCGKAQAGCRRRLATICRQSLAARFARLFGTTDALLAAVALVTPRPMLGWRKPYGSSSRSGRRSHNRPKIRARCSNAKQ